MLTPPMVPLMMPRFGVKYSPLNWASTVTPVALTSRVYLYLPRLAILLIPRSMALGVGLGGAAVGVGVGSGGLLSSVQAARRRLPIAQRSTKSRLCRARASGVCRVESRLAAVALGLS